MKIRNAGIAIGTAGLLGLVCGLNSAGASSQRPADADFIEYRSSVKNPVNFTKPAVVEVKPTLEKKVIFKGPHIILQRAYGKENTSGKLYEDLNENGVIDGDDLYLTRTSEPIWRQNLRNVSCIPEGTYSVRIRKASESKKFDKDHFLVEKVLGKDGIFYETGNKTYGIDRTAILIHGMGRSEGCIMTPDLDKLVNQYRDGFTLSIRSKKN